MTVRPADFPPFRPRPPWLGGDLQTVRNYLRRPVAGVERYSAEQFILPMRDGSGDRLVAELNRPGEDAGRPLVVLVHGLTGCSAGTYMLASARNLLEQGYPVLRLNLRGAGPSRPLCRQQYHAGRTADFRDAIAGLPPDLLANGLFAIGYSLGGNMLLKYLGEQGGAGPVLAAASISAPIDLHAASRCLMRRRNGLYHGWLLRRMQEEALAGDALTDAERQAVKSVRRVYDFDDRLVAPRNGFRDAGDYYARNSALRFLPGIKVPTLVIHALDDPWIPGVSYTSFDWATNPVLVPLLPGQGGHVGFHGLGSRVPWHDRCVGMFLERFGTRGVG